MIMALGALHPDPEEHLSRGRSQGHRVGIVVQYESDRRQVARSALGGNELAGKLVKRLVLANGLVNEGKQRAAPRGIGANSQHVGQEGGPAVGKPLVIQKTLDQQSSATLRPILEELLDFVFARDAANQVNAQFSKKLQVIQSRAGAQIILVRIVLFEMTVKFRLPKKGRRG